MPVPILPTIGQNLDQWGRQLTQYLTQNLSKLGFKTSDDNASDDGIILWDRTKGSIVVSYESAFREVATRQPTPTSSSGSSGDVAGMVAWDASYIYICTGTHDGTTAIWKRVALSSW